MGCSSSKEQNARIDQDAVRVRKVFVPTVEDEEIFIGPDWEIQGFKDEDIEPTMEKLKEAKSDLPNF